MDGLDSSAAPELVLLPEAFAAGYPPCCDLKPYAENRTTSRYLDAFRALSQRSGAMIGAWARVLMAVHVSVPVSVSVAVGVSV